MKYSRFRKRSISGDTFEEIGRLLIILITETSSLLDSRSKGRALTSTEDKSLAALLVLKGMARRQGEGLVRVRRVQRIELT